MYPGPTEPGLYLHTEHLAVGDNRCPHSDAGFGTGNCMTQEKASDQASGKAGTEGVSRDQPCSEDGRRSSPSRTGDVWTCGSASRPPSVCLSVCLSDVEAICEGISHRLRKRLFTMNREMEFQLQEK